MQAKKEAVTKTTHEALWGYIESHTVPELAEIDKFEKAINLLPEPERSYQTALLWASQNDFDAAVHFFNEALKSENSFIASNYLAYLGLCAHNYFHRQEVFRLERTYCTTANRRVARNAAFGIGNTKLIRAYNLKLLALFDGAERQAYKEEGEHMTSLVEKFKEVSSLSSADIEILCDEAEAIANRRGINCVGVNYFVGSGDDNAYIIRAETQDPMVLAELNLELVELLSQEKYASKPFTSWFRSDASRSERSN